MRTTSVALLLAGVALLATGCGSGHEGAAGSRSNVPRVRTYPAPAVKALFRAHGFPLTAHPGGWHVFPHHETLSWSEPGNGVITTSNGEVEWFSRFFTVLVFHDSAAAKSALSRSRASEALQHLPWRLRSNLLLIDNDLRAAVWRKALRVLDSVS